MRTSTHAHIDNCSSVSAFTMEGSQGWQIHKAEEYYVSHLRENLTLQKPSLISTAMSIIV